MLHSALSRKFKSAILGGVCVSLICAHPALAQTTPEPSIPTGAEDEEGVVVEDANANADDQSIVVTAQRREERLNDVGISVVAVSGDQLVNRGIENPIDLVKIVPGLTAAETPYGTPVLTLRGVGFYESSLAGSSPVSAYIDEIPLPYSRMAAGSMLDLQRVEVLKGPQGTLYGQNSTGGAINFIANKPTDHFTAGFDASYGRFDDVDLQGFVSGPVTSTIRARLAVRTNHADDWQKSVSRDDEMGETHFWTGRMLVDWELSPRLNVQLNLNGFIDKSDTQAFAATGFFPNNPLAVTPAELAASLTPPGNNRLADWDADKEFERDNNFYQLASKLTYELADWADLILLAAYQDYRQDQMVDADATNSETATSTQDGYIKSFSTEARLQGSINRLTYVLGANFSHDKIYDNSLFIVGDGSQANGFPGLEFRIGRTFSNQSAKTYAAFGNVEFRLTEKLKAIGGLRYTDHRRKFSGCLGDPGPIGEGRWAALFSFVYATTIPLGGCTTFNPSTFEIGLVKDAMNEDNISWRAGLNYYPDSNKLFYATISRGYKSGSFSTVGGAISSQYEPATQESLLAYEIGSKLSLFNRRLQVNGALFYYDYTDKQFRGKIADPIFGTIEKLYNVPKSRVKGGEIQISARPWMGSSVNLNAAYTDSKIQSDFLSLTPIGTPTQLKGQEFELTPKWAFGLNVLQEFEISPALRGFGGVDYLYQTKSQGGYGNLPIFEIDSYGLLDVQAGLKSPDDNWRIAAWVRNLTDEYYWTNANYLGEFSYRVTGRPRTYGISVSKRFMP